MKKTLFLLCNLYCTVLLYTIYIYNFNTYARHVIKITPIDSLLF